MKQNLFRLICGLCCLSAPLLHAGSESGNGGGSIVCFSIPLSEAVNFYNLMTPEGRTHIKSAEVYDLFKVGTVPSSSFYSRIKELDFINALNETENLLNSIPDFRTKIKNARNIIGLIPNGFTAPNGLALVGDAGTVLGLPQNCAFIQTAVRNIDQLSFDPTVWATLPEYQKAILQFHEELYYIGAEVFQPDSTGAQLLIISLLTKEQTPESLRNKLQQYGFGAYSTLSEVQRGKAKLLNAYAFAIPRFETFIAHVGLEYKPDPQGVKACQELTTLSSQLSGSASSYPEFKLPPLKEFGDELVTDISHAKSCDYFWMYAKDDLKQLKNKQTNLQKLPF